MRDLDRLSKREAYQAGLEDGAAAHQSNEAAAVALKPGWMTSEFWLTVATVAFATWVGVQMVLDPELDLERGAAIVGLVVAAAWKYQDVRKTVKAEAVK
jgi:hypothetical protein